MRLVSDLTQNIQIQIISYLDVPTTFLSLPQVCKQLYTLISTAKFIPYYMLKQLMGSDLPQEWITSQEYGHFLGLLKRVYNSDEIKRELPFYAFKSNMGCYQNSYGYFFNSLFRQGAWKNISSKAGSKFSISGTLAYDYYNQKDLSNIKDMPLNPEEVEKLTEYLSLQKELCLKQMLQSKPLETYDFELPYEPLQRMAIIRHIKISRPIDFTCPVKTLMLYVSRDQIQEQDDPVVSLIGSPATTMEINALYEKHSDVLPHIYMTNVEILKPWAENYSVSTDSTSFVIFKNSKKAEKAKPMAWIQFEGVKEKDFGVRLAGENFFCGNHVLVKLVNCEDMRARWNYYHEPNIDVSSVSLEGTLL